MGHRRATLPSRFGDALLPQSRGTAARRRCAADAPPLALSGSSGGIIEKKLCESKYCCNFAVMESVCAPWSAIKRERRANRRQYPLL